ncbi:MAG: M23 family metallopeptidase [Patescibacteria group bacterium]
MIFCPLPGKPLITQGFGQNPDRYAPFGMKGHDGIDFETEDGTLVYAPHDGIATVKDDGANTYGLHLIIDDGKRRSVLAHLSEVKIQSGQQIYQGDPVCKAGSSGNITGSHLHWTFKILKNGQVQNKDNGYNGAVDVTEFTRLWLDQDLHFDAEYSDEAKAYLTMTFGEKEYLRRTKA